MSLPLAARTSFGIMSQLPTPEIARATVAMAEAGDYESIWVGDHLAFTGPIADPMTSLAYAAALSPSLRFGTSVYLLPLRHPTPVAKQIATLDHLCQGRLVLGVGVGGEFPAEFAAAGVPVNERGARLGEGIEVLRKLWTGRPVAHEGRFFSFPQVTMLPAPYQDGGPPIWAGGRSDAALRRCGRLTDGYVSYVVTPAMYAEALAKIEAAAEAADRAIERFDTAHLYFVRIDDSYEQALDVAADHLTVRYGMDFRKPAQRYCALGSPADVAQAIEAFHDAGTRTFIIDMVSPPDQRADQYRRFAEDVRPLLGRLTA